MGARPAEGDELVRRLPARSAHDAGAAPRTVRDAPAVHLPRTAGRGGTRPRTDAPDRADAAGIDHRAALPRGRLTVPRPARPFPLGRALGNAAGLSWRGGRGPPRR